MTASTRNCPPRGDVMFSSQHDKHRHVSAQTRQVSSCSGGRKSKPTNSKRRLTMTETQMQFCHGLGIALVTREYVGYMDLVSICCAAQDFMVLVRTAGRSRRGDGPIGQLLLNVETCRPCHVSFLSMHHLHPLHTRQELAWPDHFSRRCFPLEFD